MAYESRIYVVDVHLRNRWRKRKRRYQRWQERYNQIMKRQKDRFLFYIKIHKPVPQKKRENRQMVVYHKRLLNTLKGIKGKFVLSYNADDVILELYKDFNMKKVQRLNTLSSTKNSDYKEVIIKNF